MADGISTVSSSSFSPYRLNTVGRAFRGKSLRGHQSGFFNEAGVKRGAG